ncbi:MAG: VWA domain-containing protein, partial [Verrucomicrobiota bacterium]
MQFLSPFLLWGLALASVPIIIHLLFRRRFTRVQWAPMYYLKLTLRKNRRRLRLEQWLLLLIRTLFVIFLILAVARPILSESRILTWFAGQGQTARLIVLDDSLSMSYRAGERSVFEQARGLVEDIVGELKPRDTLTLVLASDLSRPVFKEVHADEPDVLIATIRNLEPADAPVRWSAVFQKADELLRAFAHPVRDVTVLTDFRAAGWDAAVTPIFDAWAERNIGLNLVDLGSLDAGNLALLELRQDQSVALAGAPIRYRAVIRNDETFTVSGAQATLRIGDRSQPVMLPDLEPGEQTELILTASFNSPGQRVMSLSLPDDRMNADNHRWVIAEVRQTFNILLVDGEPGARTFESETDFLSMAFSAGDVAWQVEHTIDADWLSARPEDPDLLVLANVAEIPDQRASVLLKQVERGMGLMIFPGDQVDLQRYNQFLYRGGNGLLPGSLNRVIEEPLEGWQVE